MHSLSLLEPNVQNWIEHVWEPKQLLLAWQAPDHFGNRFRWAVGEISREGDNYALRYLQGSEFESLNQGKTVPELLALGYRGYPAFDPRQIRHAQNVLPILMRRMPPRGRADFSDYKRLFRLPPDTSVSDFTLLGITEAKLPNDGFSLVDRLDGTAPHRELLLEVAGHRYYHSNLPRGNVVGDPVALVPEPENKFDRNAVMVRFHGLCVGYINRLQTDTFSLWLSERRVTGVVERVNGNPQRPRLFIFVRVVPRLSVSA
jgi:hypothetical protein